MRHDESAVDEFLYKYDLPSFGQFLSARRKGQGLTQSDMAIRLRCNQASISRIENGSLPKSRDTALAIAKSYNLSVSETRAYLELLYGIPTTGHAVEVARWRREQGLLRLNEILELLMGEQHLSGDIQDHFYYRARGRNVFYEQGPDFIAAVRRAVKWLLRQTRWPLGNALILELTPLVIHHLNDQGNYQLRLQLVERAIQAAGEKGYSTIEGWLRSDALPWTLMEQRKDLMSAFKHLKQGLELAKASGDKDMEATALALLAQNCKLRNFRTSAAHEYLDSAMKVSCSPQVQRRIYGAAGDLAFAEQRLEAAFDYYSRAAQLDVQYGRSSVFTPSLWLKSTYLELEASDFWTARDKLLIALDRTRTFRVPIRIARIYYSLAILSEKAGELENARYYTSEALGVLSAADEDLRLLHHLQVYERSLSGNRSYIVPVTNAADHPPAREALNTATQGRK